MIFFIEELSQAFNGMELFAVLLAYFTALIFALSFHEFAHAFAAYKSGDDTAKLQGRLTLNPTKHVSGLGMLMFVFFAFGWAKPVEVNPAKFRNYKKSMTFVSLAGIATNIILSILSVTILGFIILWGGPITAITNNLHLFFYYLFYFSSVLNVVLAVFNFLPVFPLDGFKFMETWLRPENKFLEFMRRYGHFVLLIFIITPLFEIVVYWLIGVIQTIGLFIPSLFL